MPRTALRLGRAGGGPARLRGAGRGAQKIRCPPPRGARDVLQLPGAHLSRWRLTSNLNPCIYLGYLPTFCNTCSTCVDCSPAPATTEQLLFIYSRIFNGFAECRIGRGTGPLTSAPRPAPRAKSAPPPRAPGRNQRPRPAPSGAPGLARADWTSPGSRSPGHPPDLFCPDLIRGLGWHARESRAGAACPRAVPRALRLRACTRCGTRRHTAG